MISRRNLVKSLFALPVFSFLARPTQARPLEGMRVSRELSYKLMEAGWADADPDKGFLLEKVLNTLSRQNGILDDYIRLKKQD